MCFVKFIKCPKGALCLAWDEMLIHGDVGAVILALLTTNSEVVQLLTLLVPPSNCSMTTVEIRKLQIRHKNKVQPQRKLHYTVEMTIQTYSHWLV